MSRSWDLVPLGEVVSVLGGYPFKSTDWRESGVPVIKIANVKDGYVDLTGCSFVAESVAAEAASYSAGAGDILIGMTGTVGLVARATPDVLPALVNQRVGRVVLRNKDMVDPAFLLRVLRLPETRSRFQAVAGGSAQANISGSQIESVVVPLPPRDEQARIAALLAGIEERVGLHRAEARTLESLGETATRWLLADDGSW